MRISYLYIGTRKDCAAKENVSPVAVLDPTRITTCNERWIDMKRRLRKAELSVTEPRSCVFNPQSGNPFAFVYTDCELVATEEGQKVSIAVSMNPLNTMVSLTKEDQIDHGIDEAADYIGKEDMLCYVEIDKKHFLPLAYKGLKGKDVMDSYSTDTTCGFVVMLPKGSGADIFKVTGVMETTNGNKRCYECQLPLNLDDTLGTLPQPLVKRMKNYPNVYHTMLKKNTFWAMTPERTGLMPTSIVFYAGDRDEAIMAVEKAVKKYRRPARYGDTMRIYQIGKKLEKDPWRATDIHLIEMDTKMSFDDWKEHLIERYKETVLGKTDIPIRAVSIIAKDDIRLPVEFRKRFKIRYVNHIMSDGTIKAFVTNKY